MKNIYIAGPMRGIENFNFPAFFAAEKYLTSKGFKVFNPARRDVEAHGTGVMNSKTGDLADIKGTGFSLRDALQVDTEWICKNADAVALLPNWASSKGACAEKALADALGLTLLVLGQLGDNTYVDRVFPAEEAPKYGVDKYGA